MTAVTFVRMLLLGTLTVVLTALPVRGQMDWARLAPTNLPPCRWKTAMAVDATRQRIVLFGGLGTAVLNDTWEWDGNTWSLQKPVVSPLPPACHGFAYNPVGGSVVLFGGGNYFRTYDDTWEYKPRDLIPSSRTVSISTGGHVILALDAGTHQSGKIYFVVGCMEHNTPRGIVLGGVTLLLNPDPYFWLTVLYPDSLIANSLGTLDASGRASATVRVPRLPPSVVGARFYHAYVVFQSRHDYASTPVPLTLVP